MPGTPEGSISGFSRSLVIKPGLGEVGSWGNRCCLLVMGESAPKVEVGMGPGCLHTWFLKTPFLLQIPFQILFSLNSLDKRGFSKPDSHQKQQQELTG